MAYLPSGRLNASITGNTAGTASLLTAGTMYLAGGNNVTLSQSGGTISFNAPGAAQASVNFSASNASANLASVNFINSNNVSFGLTNGSQIFGSASFAQSVQTQNNIQAVGAGTVTAATGTVVFGNANGVAFGMNGQTVTASYTTPPAASNVIGASGGNVSGNVGTVNSSNFSYVFAGGNNITLSQSITSNSATLSISGPSFANANNVTLGISNNGVVTGSASFAQSAQTQNVIQGIQAAGSLNTSGTISFANSNNVAFGLSNGTMTASYTAGSNAFGVSGGNNVNSSVVSGSNAGLVLAGGNNITLSQSVSGGSLAQVTISGPSLANANGFAFGTNAGNVTASYTGNAFISVSASGSNANYSALTFANSNSITFGMSNGVITASAAPDGIQGVSANGSSIGNGNLSFANSNNINFGLNGSVLTASANVAGGGVAIGANAATFSTGTLGLNAAGAVNFVTAGQSLTISAPGTSSITATNITLSTNGNTIGFSGPAMFDAGVSNIGNTAGQTNVTGITNGIVFAGGNNITLSQSTSNNGNATITINGPNAGGAAATISNWEPNLLQNVSLTTGTLGVRTVNFYKLQVPGNVYASQLLQLVSATMSTSSNSTGAVSLSIQAGIYSANGSTLSLITQSSGSGSVAFTASGTSGTSNWVGLRGVSISMPVSFSGGNYWIGLWSNSTNANMTGYVSNQIVMNNTYSYSGFFNQANNATQGIQEGVGYYSAATAGLPAAAPMSQILGQSVFANGRIPYLNFKNLTW